MWDFIPLTTVSSRKACSKNIYDYTTGSLDSLTPIVVNYTYGDAEWKDLLTSYNGQAITYDEIGNPTNYYNGMYFQWQNGRQLKGGMLGADLSSMFAYRYNDAGIRTYKNIGGTKTDYFLDGSTIIAQKTGDNTIWYYYDSDGTLEAMEYNGNVYYYFYNAQGDVMGLYDNNAGIVALYAYDSWGKVLSVTDKDGNAITDKTHVANVNPFRYRGYYYDEETGFYYLNSRYYDPETGRFINADGFVSTGQDIFSYNMFTYCGNNPINRADPSGMFWKEIGNWFKNAWNSIKTWAKNTFGCGSSSIETTIKDETVYIPDPLPITAKAGVKAKKLFLNMGILLNQYLFMQKQILHIQYYLLLPG